MEILGKEKNEVIAEVRNGRYPPCIYYQVLYTGGVAERRRAPGLWTAELQGSDVKLFFSCKVLQELGTTHTSTCFVADFVDICNVVVKCTLPELHCFCTHFNTYVQYSRQDHS